MRARYVAVELFSGCLGVEGRNVTIMVIEGSPGEVEEEEETLVDFVSGFPLISGKYKYTIVYNTGSLGTI